MLGCFFEDTAARGLSRRSLTICIAMWQPNWVLLISRPCQRSDLCLARALGLRSTRRWPIYYLSHGRQRLTGGPDFVRRFAQFPTHNDSTPTPRLRRLPLHFQRLAHCSRSGFFFGAGVYCHQCWWFAEKVDAAPQPLSQHPRELATVLSFYRYHV